MYGDDADDLGPSKSRSWIHIRPGLAVEIEYKDVDYEMAQSEDEVDARLTGEVRITREQIFAADFTINSITGKEK